METVHELGVLDGVDDERFGEVTTGKEVGRLYDLIGVRDKQLISLRESRCVCVCVRERDVT